jgi:hypothetical protein
MKITSLLFLILVSFSVLAQTSQGFDQQQNVNSIASQNGLGFGTIRTVKPQYEGVIGTPYYSDEFLPGVVNSTEDKRFTGNFNLDVLIDLPVYTKDVTGKERFTLDKSFVKSMELKINNDSTVLFEKIKDTKGEFFYGQFISRIDSNVLYLRIKKSIKKADYSGAYNGGRKSDEFLTGYSYLLVKDKETPSREIKLNKKNLISLFPQYEIQINQYSNLLDAKKPGMIYEFFNKVLQ